MRGGADSCRSATLLAARAYTALRANACPQARRTVLTGDPHAPTDAALAVALRVAEQVALRWPVAAAWLFGSGAAARLTETSDLDVALLLLRPADPLQLATLAAELSGLAGRPVQLVDIAHAGPILGRQVLQHGVLVLDARPAHRLHWQARVLCDYDDLKYMRRPLEDALLQRLRDRH